jgi:catechol 2,3-dioxygenase-like lactoylglutathione lyase family enzyme
VHRRSEREDDVSDITALIHIFDVRTVGIPVASQDAALDFYAQKLGFEKRIDIQFGEAERWVEVAPPGGGTTIALVRRPAGAPLGIYTGIRLESRDVAADHAQLRAAGVDVDVEVMPYPVPMFSFRDADGNRLVVVGRPT